MHIEVSLGEVLDKISILEIKSERMTDAAQLGHVARELEALRAAWAGSPFAGEDMAADRAALRAVNEQLWQVEDALRLKEAAGSFDREFVELARSVYRTNDERAAIKRRINTRLGSGLQEEKLHPAYPTLPDHGAS